MHEQTVYGVDLDGIVHIWYFLNGAESLSWGFSGCHSKQRSDFSGFVYAAPGPITCVGCLATEGADVFKGILNANEITVGWVQVDLRLLKKG